ncbi:MAG TPA: hypothetical protein VN193_02700 [Candidatus Angelobacter sp.]|jgi:hypothetical protein|nr:hypothetical protein [Candidatus Angelobacter sp.]
MSYLVSFRDGRIAIRASAKAAALGELMSIAADGRLAGDESTALRRAVLHAGTLETALRAFGWDSYVDATGDVVNAWMTGDELAYSEEMLRALVSRIEPGSFVEFIGEDGDIWRWSFTGRHMIETYPELLWPPTSTGRWARALQVLRARAAALRVRRRAAP